MAENTVKKTVTAKKPAAKKPVMKQEEVQENTVPVSNGYSEEQVQRMIAEAVAKAIAQQKAETEQTVKKSEAKEETVTLRFHDEVNDSNIILLGENGRYGQIIGKDWTGQVRKMDFIGSFRTPTVQRLLETREMIVLDGLTDEERRLYGVMYTDGEYADLGLYNRMIKMDGDTLLDLYGKLGKDWRRMTAVRFAEAYEKGELKVSRGTLVKLNRMSREDAAEYPAGDVRRKGAFRNILDKMNAAEDED